MVEFKHKQAYNPEGEEVSFTIASGPVIIKDKKVLLNKHDDPFWKFPGGSVKSQDSIRQACIREVKEEVGLDIEIINEEPYVVCFDHDYNGKREHVLLFHFLSKISNEELKLGEDVEDSRFFSLDLLPEDLAPNIKPVLNYFKSKKLI